jgi:hypothetical protein
VRKVPAVLQALTGVRLTQGVSTQDALRRVAGEVGTVYAQRRASVSQALVVHTDDTGWRVGGAPSYLMTFETGGATVYQIRPRHRYEDVQEVIPPDYAGVMVTDRGRSYDAQAFDGVDQQKGLAPILRSIDDVLATKTGRARDCGEQRNGRWQEARALWSAHPDGHGPDLQADPEALQAEVTSPGRDRCLKAADYPRRRHDLGGHHDGGNLGRFLEDPRSEPTHHRAAVRRVGQKANRPSDAGDWPSISSGKARRWEHVSPVSVSCRPPLVRG